MLYRSIALSLSILMIPTAGWAEEISLFNGKNFSGWKWYLKDENAKMENTWTIKDGVILCAGKPAGYLLTEKEYQDYVLTLQWRFPPGSKGGNSGVFVHVVGPDKIWPKGVEAQLQSGRAGDFWLVDGAKLDVDSTCQDPKVARHYFRTKDDVEKPIGEWNAYEITCKGDTITLVINGQEVNRGTNSELTKGRILLQSEGVPIEFRDIKLKTLP